MKKIKIFFFVCFLILSNISVVFAAPQTMPLPQTNSVSTTDAEDPTDPPPGVAPIDDNLLFLTIAALGLGSVVIYRNKIKKASV